MKADKEMQDDSPKPNYAADENVNKRLRAGRRSSARNAGKDFEEEVKPVMEEPKAEEGGIVAEATKELEAVQEEKAEGGEGAPAEEMAEGEIPKPEGEEIPKPEEEESNTPVEEAMEEGAVPLKRPTPRVEEYQAPEGESHDELIDKYHEALAFGDIEQAKVLYKQLQEHRFAENRHRGKSIDQAEQEAQDYQDTAEELAKLHPELDEDGLPANKVMALADAYRQEGMTAAESLRKAVADLYPAGTTEEPPMPTEEMPQPMQSEGKMPPVTMNEGGMVPDMTAREALKRTLPATPTAAARNEPPPPPEAPTRAGAIEKMRKARGQG